MICCDCGVSFAGRTDYCIACREALGTAYQRYDYLVAFYGLGNVVHQRIYYKCKDKDEALERLRLEHGQDAVERVVNIIEVSEPTLFDGDRMAFIHAEVEAMDWPDVISDS
jgi:hypothetical protein